MASGDFNDGPIMLTELNALMRFGVADEAIAKMADEYLPLKIADVNDAVGFKAVHEARMIVKSKRVDVEKVRKELKADALEYGRKVDAEAKRITAMLQPIELHLTAQEEAYQAEKERIRNAARLAAEAEARAKAEAEAARLRAEQDRIRMEQEAEARRLQAMRDKVEAEQRVLEAEKRRLADIEAARIRAEEMERAKAEAAEQARQETESRIAREAAEAKAGVEREEAVRLRAEALRPDAEKLLSVAAALRSFAIPPVTVRSLGVAAKIRATIENAALRIEQLVSMAVTENW